MIARRDAFTRLPVDALATDGPGMSVRSRKTIGF
jgi:hypothetical protein